jgi:D-cysteine desulfhydrase
LDRRVDIPLTPIVDMDALGARIGARPGRLRVLREDLIGLDGGGNKVRKAAAALDRAARDGMQQVITTGAVQSNHARAVAMAAARRGIRCVLVLEGEPPAERAGNLILEHLAGAHIEWARSEPLEDVAARLITETDLPTQRIPFGGSDRDSTLVYAEVGDQIQETLPDIDHIVVAVGSGATAAGLIRSFGARRVLTVDTGAVADPAATLERLLDHSIPDLRLDRDQVGSGYEHIQPAVSDALQLAMRTEGIVFDATYAGRALAGLIAAYDRGAIRPEERTLLIHTGGVPGSFGHPELRSPTP